VKSKKAEITNYYIEQSWSVSLKNIGRQNFVHNSHRTQCNPIHGHLWCTLPPPKISAQNTRLAALGDTVIVVERSLPVSTLLVALLAVYSVRARSPATPPPSAGRPFRV